MNSASRGAEAFYGAGIGAPLATWIIPPGVRYEIWPDSVRTIFPDGSELASAPQRDRAYIARARSLGYRGSDAMAAMTMCQGHDLAHHIVAGLRGEVSPTLLAVARHEASWPGWREEEARVFRVQRAMAGVGERS